MAWREDDGTQPHVTPEQLQRDQQLVELQQRASQVSFYQSLLLIERLFNSRVRIGHEGPPEEESVRIRPSLSLAHPATDVESIELRPEDERVQVTATFLGLYGSDSPLPTAYSEHIANIADEERGERVRAFLDLFHHRLYSLLFRAFTKSRPVGDTAEKPDPLFDRALAFVGYSRALGFGGERLPRLREVRLTALRTRTASGLRSMLRYRLGYEIGVSQLRQRMTPIPDDQLTLIGKQSSRLGDSVMLGARVRDRGKISLDVEADDFDMWVELTPEGGERAKINDALAGYLRDPIDYDVHVTMDREHVPVIQLGNPALKLGRTAWLGKPRPRADKRWPRLKKSALAKSVLPGKST
ncbi:MAG: type VI secretion system baseplate subunit TssG [Myxococcales bacterium]|nr:type VI secretion system baseplate subunit TssG [Myxococcales bacterium]